MAALSAIRGVIFGVDALLGARHERATALKRARAQVAAWRGVGGRRANLAAAAAVRRIRLGIDARAGARGFDAAVAGAMAALTGFCGTAQLGARPTVVAARPEVDAFSAALGVAGIARDAAFSASALRGAAGRSSADVAAATAVFRVRVELDANPAARGVAGLAGQFADRRLARR